MPGPACDALGAIAREHEVFLAIPVNERDGGTVYNTILYFGADGTLLGKHRKLDADRRRAAGVGQGDGSTMPVFDTPFGRVGGLICWENYMPLARVAMYEQHVDILLAPTWDNSDVWPVSMRHIAKEGRCYVLGVTSCLRASDVPADIPGRDEIYGGDDDWMSRGNTIIVDPYGNGARRPGQRDRDDPLRGGRSADRRERHAASSTSSATTPAPTSSPSASATATADAVGCRHRIPVRNAATSASCCCGGSTTSAARCCATSRA